MGGPKKLTWSERQALAKQQAEAETQQSKAASWQSPASTGVSTASSGRFGARVGAAAVGGAVVGGAGARWARRAAEPEPEAELDVPAPPVGGSVVRFVRVFGADQCERDSRHHRLRHRALCLSQRMFPSLSPNQSSTWRRTLHLRLLRHHHRHHHRQQAMSRKRRHR